MRRSRQRRTEGWGFEVGGRVHHTSRADCLIDRERRHARRQSTDAGGEFRETDKFLAALRADPAHTLLRARDDPALPIAASHLGGADGAYSALVSPSGRQRHEAHDWGEVSQPDAAANELAASGGGQVLSSYAVPRHVDGRGDLRDRTLCVITDAAGPASVSATTTVLFRPSADRSATPGSRLTGARC